MAATIRVVVNYREAIYIGVWKSQYPYFCAKIPRSAYPIYLSRLNTLRDSPNKEAGAVSLKHFWQGGYHRIRGGTSVLEPTVDSREAALAKGVRSTSTIAPRVEHTHTYGWSLTQTTRWTTTARGVARFGSIDFRSTAAGKPWTEGFG
jgi:hypothetical protein